MMKKGIGTNVNTKEAFKYMKMAADKGYKNLTWNVQI